MPDKPLRLDRLPEADPPIRPPSARETDPRRAGARRGQRRFWRAAATRGSSSLALYRSRMSFRAESRIPAPEDVIQFVVEDLRPRL
jgi:hypothetical protein